MSNLTPSAAWSDVYKIELTDWIDASKTGVSNAQAQALLNRLQFLYNKFNTLLTKMNSYDDPIGTIKLWFSSLANLPAGWQLCDGTNGTPNLTNKFVVGAGDLYALGASVGSNTLTSSLSSVSNSGEHTHNVAVSGDGWHYHYFTVTLAANACTGPFYPKSSGGYPVNCSHNHGEGSIEVGGGNHYHNNSVSSVGGIHKHTVSITNCEIMPAYYKVYHIMRIS